MSTGVCPDQNRTVRNHNAHRCDERLQVLLPHPRLPCGPSWRIRLIPGRYKTPSHRGPSASAEGLTYYRSEERRVGKECRSRWESEPYKKKREHISVYSQ